MITIAKWGQRNDLNSGAVGAARGSWVSAREQGIGKATRGIIQQMSEAGYAAVYSILYAILQCDANVEGQRLWGVCNVCMHALEGQKKKTKTKKMQNRSRKMVDG